MRLLVLSEARERAGAERYVEALTRALTRVEPSVQVEALLPDDAPAELVQAWRAAGVRVVHQIPGLSRRPTVKGIRALRQVVRETDPDVVLVNLSDQGGQLTPLLSLRGLSTRRIGVCHLFLPDRRRGLDRLGAWAMGTLDEVLVPGQGVAMGLAKLGVRAAVVPNGVDPVTALPALDARRELGLGAGPVIGAIGRLHPQKGFDLLLQALPLVREKIPAVQLAIIGDGPSAEQLHEQGKDLGVIWRGYHPQAATLLSAFDVLAVPSRFEAQGLVAVEAAQAGVPVVATDLPGLRDCVMPRGRIVPVADVAALAGALVEVLRAQPLGAAEVDKERAHAVGQWSPDEMALRTLTSLRGSDS